MNEWKMPKKNIRINKIRRHIIIHGLAPTNYHNNKTKIVTKKTDISCNHKCFIAVKFKENWRKIKSKQNKRHWETHDSNTHHTKKRKQNTNKTELIIMFYFFLPNPYQHIQALVKALHLSLDIRWYSLDIRCFFLSNSSDLLRRLLANVACYWLFTT